MIRHPKFLILFCMTAIVASGCTQKNPGAPVHQHQPSVESETEHHHDHAEEIWTCPMHPQIKKDGPGACPICGMNLVKVETAQDDTLNIQDGTMPDGHAAFKLSLERQQMIGVKFGVVEKKPLFKSIEASGRVAFDPELYTAQNEYLEAVKQDELVRNSPLEEVRNSSRRMAESAKLRLKILGLSDEQIHSLTLHGTTGSNLLVTKLGENIWIYAEVFEMDLPSIQPGLKVTISGGSLEHTTLKGAVVSVDRVINPVTRTTKVRILIPSLKTYLRPEAYVDVTIHAPLGEQITVPFDAVLDLGRQAWVFVVKDQGVFEPRLVTILYKAGDTVAIGSGLNPGDKIVTSANFLIDSESRLKGVLAAQSHAPTSGALVSDDKPTQEKSSPEKELPKCPKGQEWHAQMNMCMPKPGS